MSDQRDVEICRLQEECNCLRAEIERLKAALDRCMTGGNHKATNMSIKPLFAWYDLWVGLFWDRKSRKLYVLPLPCIGIVIQFRAKATR